MASPEPGDDRGGRAPGPAAGLVAALTSRRTAAVTLMSFASGLPLGLVWIAIPDWMTSAGFDIRVVGLTTVAQAPWTFKVLWAPLMDRYRLPWLGRRRGWIALTQVVLAALTLGLAGAGDRPETPWVLLGLALAIACASASQDIVIDAYAVDVLRPEERGVAVGARTALYRLAMRGVAAVAITLAARWSWEVACLLLALLWLPLIEVTRRAPEPPTPPGTPPTLAESVWQPLVGFLRRPRALEILAFVVLYKLADNLSQSLLLPFLNRMGYDAVDRGVGYAVISLGGTIGGTFLGGAATNVLGVGRSLWIFGVLQIVSNVGFLLIASSEPDRLLMYGAMAFETVTTGTGMGAFGVFLLQITQRRFSATQYALFSSLFALPRIVAGPVVGWLVHELGWGPFFWITMAAGLPGLVLLARFAPPGARDLPDADELEAGGAGRQHRPAGPPVSTAGLVRRGAGWGAAALTGSILLVAGLEALAAAVEGRPAGLGRALAATLSPAGWGGWSVLAGCTVAAAFCGLLAAAITAARRP